MGCSPSKIAARPVEAVLVTPQATSPTELEKTQTTASTPATRAGQADEAFQAPLEYPLYAMKMQDFLQLETLRDHNSLRKDGLVVALELEGKHQGAEINFVSHQWLGFREADPEQAHLNTMQDVFKRAAAGKAIFKTEEMWQTFVKGRSKQLEKSQGNEVVARGERQAWAPEKSAETFSRSVRDGWVWMDYISIPQTIGCTTAEEVATEVEAQGRAISSIPGYVLRTTNFWVCCPGGCRHVDAGHLCGYATWERRGWCRMEATCADIAKVFDSRALFVMQRLGEPSRVETVDFMDRMQLGMQKRSSVLNGDFSCCRMGHQVTAAGSGEKVAIPCDKDRLREVLTDLLHRQTGRLRSIWEARLDSLPSDTSARNFESMMGADGGAWFKFLVMTFLEQNILSEVPKEAWEEASDLWWVAKGWVSDGVASDAQVAEFNRLFGYEMPGPDADAETLERHLNGWVWQQGMFGNVPLLRHLVEVRGGDVTHVNRHGMTALKLAATFGQLPMIRYICEYTKGDLAHLNHISSGLGLTSLGCAAKCGHFQCCQELLRHGGGGLPLRFPPPEGEG